MFNLNMKSELGPCKCSITQAKNNHITPVFALDIKLASRQTFCRNVIYNICYIKNTYSIIMSCHDSASSN